MPGYRGLWTVTGTEKLLANSDDDTGKEEKGREARRTGRGRRKSEGKESRGSDVGLYWVWFSRLVISSGVSRSDIPRSLPIRCGRKRKAGQYLRKLWFLGY